MRSPLPATVVIECPHCGTRYQVSADTIGPRGRQVQCAHCARAWQAEAAADDGIASPTEDAADRLFDETEERDLDAAFAAAEAAAAAAPATGPGAQSTNDPVEALQEADAPAPPTIDPPAHPEPTAADRKHSKAFSRRQKTMVRRLPLARFRRVVRVVALTGLAALAVGFVAFRTEIVRTLPDLAGVYEALGLGVNLVGLEFGAFNTLLIQRDGAPVLRVDGRIDNVGGRGVAVPPVVVSLLDVAGVSIYEWSVQAEAGDLEPRESVEFTTQLTSPPADAVQVRLSFASGRSQPDAATSAIATETP